MEDTNELKKYKQTNALDALIISFSAIISCICYIFGLFIIAYVFVAIAAGFFAKTLVLKSYIVSAVSAVISVGASLALALLLTKTNLTAVILVMSFILTGGAFALCIIKNKSKVTTIVIMSTILTFIIIVSVFYTYYMTNGNVSFSGFFDYIKNYFADIQNEFKNILVSGLSQYMDEADITAAAESLFTMIMVISGGVIIMVMEFISMLSSAFFKLSVKMSNAEVVIPSDWKIQPHKFAARLYYLAVGFYFLSMILTTFGVTAVLPVYYVSINFLLVFSPVFIAVGVRRGIEIFAKRRSMVPIIIIMIIVMGFFQPLIVVYLLGSIGASYTIIKAKRDEKLQEDENKSNMNPDGSYNARYNEYEDRYNEREYDEYRNEYPGYNDFDDRDNEYEKDDLEDDKEDEEYEEYNERFYGYKEHKEDTDNKEDE